MTRLALLRHDQLDQSQAALFDALNGGPRGGRIVDAEGCLMGPYNAWLYSPDISDAAQRLGPRMDGSV
jgi:4-carboxymuconolactone decarboxylase